MLTVRNIYLLSRMSSVLRIQREPKNVNRQFTVFPYYGVPGSQYYFVCKDNSIYRIESDLEDVEWVVARDMGKQMPITSINPEVISWWETENFWENIRIVRSGIARKFQVVNMVRGNAPAGNPDQVEFNSGAYLPDITTNIFDSDPVNGTNPINDLLIVGRENPIFPNNYEESLPYGTFWAMNDPVVIEYEFSDATYRRAIKNRIDETTLF